MPGTDIQLSPMFESGVQAAMRGDVVIPPLRSYLFGASFPGFTVEVPSMGEREPDFWFHPSTHPTWPERALWLWMVAPDLLHMEPREPQSVLAMTAGSIWHAIIEKALVDIGVLLTNEVPMEDRIFLTRGHADGEMYRHAGDDAAGELFEFKTKKDIAMKHLLTVEDLKRLHPEYVLQANEYMRMTGFRKMRFLFMALTFPFEMREIVLEYDEGLATKVTSLYNSVIQDIAYFQVPTCSNCPKKRHCPARPVCDSLSSDKLNRLAREAVPLEVRHGNEDS